MEEDGFIVNESGVQASGTVAQKLLASGLNVNYFRTNATLRKDEWLQLDDTVLRVARERLVGVSDLMGRGLSRSLNNGLGTTVFEWEDVSELTPAETTMDAITRGQNDRAQFDLKSLPLPITHKDFQINARTLAASRTRGETLDTLQVELATRQVVEKLEDTLFNGLSAYTFGGGTIRGYTDQPDRNTVTLAQNWDASGKTGEEILTDVLNMKQAAINARHYGPYMLYIPTAYETVLDDEFKTNSDKSIRNRLLEIASISDIKVADKLTANNVLLVQMSADVVRMIEGLRFTTVEWSTEGGMISHFKVMAIMVPNIRADQEGNSGIVHLS